MTRRQDRLNHRLMEILAPVIESEMEDPRLQMLNLTRIQVNRDASHAMVYFTSDDNEYSHKEMENALNRAKGFFRRVVAESLNLRYTPDFLFRYDQSVKESTRIMELFDQIAKQRVENPPDPDLDPDQKKDNQKEEINE
ncbi:MAG: 30S ribosome-binding factor RbfA [Ardenticatenaceae bacterium]